eukprot:g3886.t1
MNHKEDNKSSTQHHVFTEEEVCLVDTEIRTLIDAYDAFDFCGCHPIPKKIDLHPFVQPASLDVPIVGGAVFLVKEKVLPYKKKIIDLLPDLRLDEFSLAHGDGTLLLKGQTYLLYVGKVTLPKHCRGHLSPKSSIGRVDLMVRGVVDGCGLYDTIPSGKTSTLWLEITPQSFNVRIRKGLALTQLMIFSKGTFGKGGRTLSVVDENVKPFDAADREEPADRKVMEAAATFASPELPAPRSRRLRERSISSSSASATSLLYDESGKALPVETLRGGAVVLHLRVPTDPKDIVGYEAKHTSEVVDLSKRGAHDKSVFFRPILCNSTGRLTLEKDRFYILATKEHISVPLDISGEMVPFSNLVGELRAHYAGFFDPGFGYGKSGEKRGTVAVLEVRPHETITIYDGQPICLMEFFRNSRVPAKPYGFSGNNYAEQTGPKLAKYFA